MGVTLTETHWDDPPNQDFPEIRCVPFLLGCFRIMESRKLSILRIGNLLKGGGLLGDFLEAGFINHLAGFWHHLYVYVYIYTSGIFYLAIYLD